MISIHWLQRGLLSVCVLFSPLVAYAQTSDWDDWLATQIQQHPDVLAAREQWLGSNATADALEQPLYNPSLSSEVERKGQERNFRVGVEQTIDWWDQRGARQEQARSERIAAEALFRQKSLDKTAEALSALVEWRAADRAADIAQAQQSQLDTLFDLVQRRVQAGDLGGSDAELTFLSLSQQQTQLTEIEVALQKAEARVAELLPDWTPERGGVPDEFWPAQPETISEKTLLQHPAVATARARWQSLKDEAEVTRRSNKAEPTVGLNAGRDGGQSVVGLTLSIPLNVRNNFSAESRAAEREASRAYAQFQAVYRKKRFDWQAAQKAWQRFDQQYRRWQSVTQNRIENSADLLKRQWRSGDLSTTDYLLALNQRAQSMLAGIELEKQTKQALIDVLQESARLMNEITLTQ
ncbi:TolC family protein [Neopusillimonas maritima]|uniref:ABC transporter permease n=1 Tax=Neopusillimonas maritima TaxID=2026239 RepID=A0A3A1YMG4_9BURK|nr:TolC family protein [Neopusillimonas maritima]RIY38741.1 ABC transporter permease [Neopusillimonas maritima]